jgi:transglutaminase-like putative cysteine protease
MNPRLRITVFAALATVLGSLSLLPIFSSTAWLPRVLLMVGAIAATSASMQRVRALTTMIPLAMALVWAALVTALYAHTVAPLGFIPGPAALRQLHATMSSGFTDTVQLAAPVDVTRGLSLLTTAGVGLVAVVVETLASGLRRPAVAGLPLLAIFTVSAATISRGVGWVPFVFAAAGYLALLLAEGRDRISRWGRPVRVSRGPTGRRQPTRPQAVTAQLTQVGRRVGFAAISIAVVVPVVIPGLHSGWFGTHHTNGVGGFTADPNSGSATISPIVSIRQELNEPVPNSLFTYTTTGTPTYLRLATLDRFDGTEWTVSSVSTPADVRISKGIPTPAGVTLQPTGSAATDVRITGLRQAYLPVPSTATAVQARGDWRYNPVNPAVYGVNTSTLHLAYSATSAVYQPSPAYLNSLAPVAADQSIEPYLALPAGLSPQIHQTADEIIANAGAVTPYQKAVALQAWFQAGTYDISIKTGTSENALLTFLSTRRGFCEQFAATMALMARLEGIPARVDVGFTPGAKVANTNSYLVTTADAHAWPELYFPGAGWLRFEPTPRSDGQTTDPSYASAAVRPQPAASGTAVPNDAVVKPQLPTVRPGGVGASGKTAHRGRSFGDLSAGWLIAALVVVIGVALAPAVRWVTRRRRWTAADTEAARAHAAWDELGDDMRDLGLEWRGESDTPRRAAATLVATRRLAYDVAAEQALSRLTRAEELARYAAHPDELRWVDQDPRADEKTVRRALFTSVSRTRRLRARVAPPSTSRIASNATAWISDTWHAVTTRAAQSLRARAAGQGGSEGHGGRDDRDRRD